MTALTSMPARAAAALLVLLVAGCFGYPPGTARPGDLVTVQYTAVDPSSGEVLVSSDAAFFSLGTGSSGLGRDVEQALVGARLNDTITVTSPGGSRSDSSIVTTDQVLQRAPADAEYNRTQFLQFEGTADVGHAFRPNPFFNATVTGSHGGNVTFRLSPGGSQDHPELGVRVTGVVVDGEARIILLPLVGTQFTLPDGQAQLGLAPGSYETVGAANGQVQFRFTPGIHANLLDRDVRFTLKLVSVAPAGAAPAGNYGARNSPVLGTGVPAAPSGMSSHSH